MKNILMVILAAGLFTVSCAGTGGDANLGGGLPEVAAPSALPVDGDGTAVVAGLSSFPAPRGVSADTAVINIQPGSRSYLTSTAAYGAFNGVGVTQTMPDFHLEFEPSSDDQLTYTFFLINAQEEPGVTLGSISLDFTWLDDAPSTAGQGFYIGVPDYEGNSWVWDGPIQSTADVLDFSSHELGPNPEEFRHEKVALVNYSASNAIVRYVNFTTSDPADTTGDEAGFYITDDGYNSAIKRISMDAPDSPVTIVAEGSGVVYENLYVRAAGSPLLVFDRKAPAGNWEVWQAYLDGSGLAKRHSGNDDVRTGGFNVDLSSEFVIDTADNKIRRISADTYVTELEVNIPGEFLSAPRWYQMRDEDITVVVAGYTAEGEQTLMQYLVATAFEFDRYFPVTQPAVTNVMDTNDPFFARWANGQFAYTDITLYSARYEGEPTTSIHAYRTGIAMLSNNKPFVTDDMYDLHYPALSPDNRIISLVVCEPGARKGDLVLQSALMRSIGDYAAVDTDVRGAVAWFDPTPVPVPTR